MKIITVIGARPQFIKASSLSRELSKHKNIDEVIIHTGQHFDKNMSKIFFDEMEIPIPKYNLQINSLSHGAMTGQMLEEIEKVLLIEKPDWVVVYGDTNSTLAGALAAKKLHIKVAHIEAGLRSFDMKMPEEVNRILTDNISDILFCPTESAIENLTNEGFLNKNINIVNCGDIMYESALYYRNKAKNNSSYKDGFILATIHRQENTNDKQKLSRIIESFNDLVKLGEQLIIPVHPRTKNMIEKFELKVDFTIIEPVGYLEMIQLLDKCKIVITDSGGLQKEAYFFNKFCITLRDSTEWLELIENDVNVLLDIDVHLTKEIYKLVDRKIENSSELYGNGMSSKTIVENLMNYQL
jgi:UDP-GlcNAc3NAcA epimerase